MLRKEVIMKPNSFFYTVRQGFKNIWRNRLFSVASIATMTACILIFGVFFSILMNVTHMIRTLEEEVGVTALFDEGLEEARMKEIGAEIKKIDHVTEVTFTSAEEAWKNFQEEYFDGNPEYAESFAADNPLANSASYTVQVDAIENQDAVVAAIEKLDGIRQVNQSAAATQTLIGFNRLFTYVSVAIIAVLLVVAVFLIANTVNVGISVRREEIAIMKLIETDEKVRQQVDNVYDQRQQLKQAIENEKKKLSDEAWAAVNARVDSTKKELEAQVKAEDEKNQAYYDSASAQLQSVYEANKEKWRRMLYDRVLAEDEE